jgi:hypothetical protein
MVGVEATSNRSKGAGQLMIVITLIALAAGAASALMFASIVSGAPISLLLAYFAPLPLMVAALGWGPLAATVGGIFASTTIGLIFGLPLCVAFAITVALPAWWLGHLALLGRPVANDAILGDGSSPVAPTLEWYPLGRILLWISGLAAITTVVGLLTFSSDAAIIAAALRRLFLQFAELRGPASAGEIEQHADVLVAIVPAMVAILIMLRLTLNLWLATKIAATSGRLHRARPDLKSATLPPMTLVALSVAIAFCFVGGMFAMLAQIVAGALMMAYALIGFGVLHTVTSGSKNRGLWLSCTYGAVLLSGGWLIVVMLALGLADAVFGFRERYLRGRPPPIPVS